MSTAEKRRLTPAGYLAIEAAADVRHEFFDGGMFAISGGSLWHDIIKDNFAHALRNGLSGRGCRVVTSDQRPKVDATGLDTSPDVLVFRGPPEMEDGVHHTLTIPPLVVEVLCDSTGKYGRGIKFGHYRRLATLLDYVLVAQDRFSAEAYLRRPDGADPAAHVDQWLLSAATDPAATIGLGSLDVSVPLTEIYDGVEFPQPGPQGG